MRIISEGKLREENEYKGTCRNCGTVIEFQEKEGTVTYDQRDGDYVSIPCPLCSHPITVSI